MARENQRCTESLINLSNDSHQHFRLSFPIARPILRITFKSWRTGRRFVETLDYQSNSGVAESGMRKIGGATLVKKERPILRITFKSWRTGRRFVETLDYQSNSESGMRKIGGATLVKKERKRS